ncbi:hypothetical protein INS49_009155 [Diaporthe citri]|uniref:uncharacterized protein n=1 Tax=Diaporthe citri TaxID=83186 RepID=UPI001C80881B|nr:uncharacterized protein INS49_009155 [Diaporthe citri]KAG6364052.1 hypothetical protein INS49_009155 [Diaporthe citri]
MQLLKSIVLYGLLALGASGEPIPGCKRSGIKDVGVGETPATHLEARADPPTRRTNVDIGEARREQSGETLFTNGLASCIAIVVRSREERAEKEWDKILAHVSSTMCSDGDTPDLDTQLQNLFDLDDQTDIPSRQVFVLLNRDDDNEAQGVFNNYVLEKVGTHWGGNHVFMYRDPAHVDEPGGSRLWIDGTRQVYWSTFDDPYIIA